MDKNIELEALKLSGCSKQWNSLTPLDGNDRERFCGECQLKVHNLAAYSRSEGEKLVRGAEGRICLLKTVQPDGIVLTRTGRTAGRSRPLLQPLMQIARAASWLLLLFGGLVSSCGDPTENEEQPDDGAATSGDGECEQTEGSGEHRPGTPEEQLQGLSYLGYVDY
ncbi:MAG: hypothetical protein ACI8QS_000667 [Planctomycetota bacterium]|jgi:hypothetical protein